MQTLSRKPTVVKTQKIGNLKTTEGQPLYAFTAGDYTSPSVFTSELAAIDAAARLCYRNPAVRLPKEWQPALVALWTRQGVDAAIYGTQETLWNVFQRRAASEHLNDVENVLEEAHALLSAGLGYDWAAMELATVAVEAVAL